MLSQVEVAGCLRVDVAGPTLGVRRPDGALGRMSEKRLRRLDDPGTTVSGRLRASPRPRGRTGPHPLPCPAPTAPFLQVRVRRPVVGYLRVDVADDALVDHLLLRLAAHSERHALRLRAVHHDDLARPTTRGTGPQRPAFSRLLEMLRRGDAIGVLTPTMLHLSSDPRTAATMLVLIARAGGSLHLLHPRP